MAQGMQSSAPVPVVRVSNDEFVARPIAFYAKLQSLEAAKLQRRCKRLATNTSKAAVVLCGNLALKPANAGRCNGKAALGNTAHYDVIQRSKFKHAIGVAPDQTILSYDIRFQERIWRSESFEDVSWRIEKDGSLSKPPDIPRLCHAGKPSEDAQHLGAFSRSRELL